MQKEIVSRCGQAAGDGAEVHETRARRLAVASPEVRTCRLSSWRRKTRSRPDKCDHVNPSAGVVLQNVGSETGSRNVGIMTGQDEALRDGTGSKGRQTDGQLSPGLVAHPRSHRDLGGAARCDGQRCSGAGEACEA